MPARLRSRIQGQLAKKIVGRALPSLGALRVEHEISLVDARELNKKAQRLAAYPDEQAQLANHAVMTFLSSVVADLEHVSAKKPVVAEQFALTLEVMKQRRDAIAAGIARSKAASKSAPEPAPKGQEPAPAGPVNS